MRGVLPGDRGKSSGTVNAGGQIPCSREEAEALFDKEYQCPVCDTTFRNKAIRSGRKHSAGQDIDLRIRYTTVDAEKYNVLMCPCCGHAALISCFAECTGKKAQAVRQWMKPEPEPENPDCYTYEMAYVRFRAAMKDAMIREARTSETGFIALHTAWLLRGYAEALGEDSEGRPVRDDWKREKKIEDLRDTEKRYLSMAVEKLKRALASESFPIWGMDEQAFQYLLAALCYSTGDNAEALNLLMPILRNRETKRTTRIKAENLRDEIRERALSAKTRAKT